MKKVFLKLYNLINSKIKYQLFLLFAILNILILGFMYLSVTRILSRHLLMEKYENMAKENIYIENLLDQYIRDTSKSSLNYYYSKEMIDILSTSGQNRLDFYNDYSLKLFLTGILEMNNDTEGVYLYALDGHYVYGLNRSSSALYQENALKKTWFQKALEYHGKNLILGKATGEHTGKAVLSMCRAIINPDNYKPIGVVYIELDLEGFEKLFHSSHLENTNCIIVTDTNEQLIYTNNMDVEKDIRQISGWNQQNRNNYWLSSSGSNYYLVSRTSAYTGWNIYTITNNNVLYRNIRSIQSIFGLCMLLSVLFTFVISFFYSSALSRVLRKIIKAMKDFENGDLNVQLKVTGHNEINQLKIGFNSLISRIQHLIEAEYKIKIINQAAEIKLLRQQINPHFLYNTLGMISNQAEKEHSLKTSSMCLALAELFRYNLGKDGDVVTLKEELQNIKNYLAIQEERYNGKLICIYEIDQQFYNIRLPRMTLQPLVENAIIHGIEASCKRCCLIITLRSDSLYYILTISNTGKTLKKEKIQELNKKLEQGNSPFFKESGHIGVYNVNSRLQYYIPGSKLRFISENIGATVEIYLKKGGIAHDL